VSIPITSSGTTKVYVAYYRNGPADNSSANYLAISNVSFTTDEKTLTVDNTNSTYGSVSVTAGETDLGTKDSYEIVKDASVTLTAETQNDGQFYGWTENGKLLSTATTYKTTLTADRTIQAVFAPDGTYTARKNGVFYTEDDGGLATALADAESGDTVVMLASQTLEKNATVPEGVFLLLPCMDNDVGYAADGYSIDGEDGSLVAEHVKRYGTLTIDSGATLTVNGKVLVNAVIGTNGQTSGVDQGQISGGYATIEMAGNIVINKGGYMENFGYVNGAGQITVNDGGTLVDRYVIVHWRGGTQAAQITTAKVYPMNETDCNNITSNILINSGGTFSGVVKVQADNKYTDTRFPLVDNENGMIRLGAGATLLKTYDSEAKRSTLTITGGATFGNSQLLIASVLLTTADYLFPVDGDIGFVLEAGTYEVNNAFKLMPGCTVDVKSNATVNVNNNVTLVAYDKFADVDNIDDTEYPADRAPATLTLSGGATLNVNGTFAGRVTLGTVEGTNYATVKFAKSAKTNVTTYETNGLIASLASGQPSTVPFDFKAELWDNSNQQSTITPQPARTYYGTGSGWSMIAPGQSAISGDLNKDGVVDILDLNKALAEGNSEAYSKVLNGYQTTNSSD
jgi:hypothetical protein